MESDKKVEKEITSAPSSIDIAPPTSLKLPNPKHIPVLLTKIRDSIIGDSHSFTTPYGERKITYSDYVASGRLIQCFEEFLMSEVYPFYANTHTTASVTGKLTTLLREESRNIIMSSCGGSKKEDLLIFCGSGATEAVNTLIKLLDIESQVRKKNRKVIVFVAVYEHHSNILPWRELGCQVVLIPEDEHKGGLDFEFLESELKKVSEDIAQRSQREEDDVEEEVPLLIGSFSAASNITGMRTDEVRTTQILQKYGALSFFDFACAAPYVKMDMNQQLDSDGQVVKIDAIFFSTHKFLGGPGGPGVLIMKKNLLRDSDVVVRPGGGTVFFVTEHDHVYLKSNVMKQEGGTPNIIGSIRAGMSCYLKDQIGTDYIERREEEIDAYVMKRVKKIENLVVVGNLRAKKLPVLSFLIRTPLGLYLHGNFVSSLLNDLFGLQTRAGCMCAGPYGESLLGLDYETSKQIESILLQNEKDYGFLRPGFTRLNLHYVMNDTTIDFILDCIDFVAQHGWKFLIEYNYRPKSGSWRHYQEKPLTNRRWIHDIYFQDGKFEFRGDFKDTKITDLERKESGEVDWKATFDGYIKFAEDYVSKTFQRDVQPLHSLQKSLLTEDVNKFRWFILPDEAYMLLKGEKDLLTSVPEKCVVQPRIYPSSEKDEKMEEKEGEEDDDDDDFVNPLLQIGDFEDEEEEGTRKRESGLWKSVPASLYKITIEGIEQFGMIKKGDNLLLGVSGGKDSMTLLHVLHEIRKRSRVKFGLGCCTIDPCANGYDPSALKPYMEKLGVEYHYVKHDVIELAKSVNKSSICSFCSRMRRGLLYSTARKHGYNVLVLAQHLDDLVESFLMSVFHNGVLRTMKANYVVDEGDLRVVRPLAFCRERWLKNFAKKNKLPVIFENCPACFEIPKERKRIKKLLKAQESLFPHLYQSFKGALVPLMEKGEIYMEDSQVKKFKTRKQKEMEKESAITGMTKGVAKQRKVISSAPIQFLFDELKRRKKMDMSPIKEEEEEKVEKKEPKKIPEKKQDNSWVIFAFLGLTLSFLMGILVS